MKLLLTSAGVKNPSIHDALVGLLGKPIADCSALCIPTALYGHPQGSPGGAWRFIAGKSGCPMVMTPRVGEDFVATKPSITGDDVTLGVVDFSIFPHLDYPGFPENTMANAERWAVDIGGPAYAIDDETAIKVVDGKVEVVSEGNWRYFGA
jgi:hypothetical protein